MRSNLDASVLVMEQDQLSEYTSRFDDVFARADQREWFRLYVRGLLTAPDRKNVEAIATEAAFIRPGANLGQALQHFVTDSPWDHTSVLARYREQLAAAYRDGATTWVIHDVALLKKGRNSVGTQRQFARSMGRKVNCQVAVVVGLTGRAGYIPLAARLYLPGYWLREEPELAIKTVPQEHRGHTTKTAIALALLDELRAEGWSAGGAALDEGYATADGFTESLAQRDIRPTPAGHDALKAAGRRFEWMKSRLGLDHFEGRTWIGWHHHTAMVLAAAGFLLLEASEELPE
jgi:SRSO17 transposase